MGFGIHLLNNGHNSPGHQEQSRLALWSTAANALANAAVLVVSWEGFTLYMFGIQYVGDSKDSVGFVVGFEMLQVLCLFLKPCSVCLDSTLTWVTLEFWKIAPIFIQRSLDTLVH